MGAGALSEAELLSVIMREGHGGGSAVAAGQKLLDECGGLAAMAAAPLRSLRQIGGLGTARAAQLAAAFELARRLGMAQNDTPQTVTTSAEVGEMFRARMAGLDYEEFWVLYLSAANTVLGRERAGHGGAADVAVDHKLVVKRAVELLASGVVLVHNHPSGVAEPSAGDHEVTARIVAAAALFDIEVVDHIIVTTGGHFSFRQARLLQL